MRLQTKTIWLVVLSFLGLALLIYGVLTYLLDNHFLRLEEKIYLDNMTRVANSLEKDIQSKQTIIEDYAIWHETYDFMENKDDIYLSEEWTTTILARYQINAVVFIDLEGNIIASRAIDLELKEEIPLAKHYIDTLNKNKTFWIKDAGEKPKQVTGIVMSDAGPIIMLSHQIMDSNSEKPSCGYLIAFRIVDNQYIEELSKIVKLPLSITNLITTVDCMKFSLPEAKDSIIIKWLDDKYSVGEYLVNTIDGHPGFILVAIQRRDIHDMGVQTIYYLIKFVFVASICFTFLLIYFLRKIILSRLSDLILSLQQISKSKNLGVRLIESRNDEITDVSKNINQMIKALQESKEQSAQITEELYASNEALGELTATLELRVKEKTVQLEKQIATQIALNNAASSFVPYGFLKALDKNDILEIRPGDYVEKEITVLFIDIRSYTTISERMTNQEVFKFINFYLDIAVKIISKNNGFIDKFIGDAIMGLFPSSVDDALCTVLELNEALKHYNSQTANVPIKTGAGIHYGELILGTVGIKERMDTTVLGDAVNLAARLEAATKIYGMNSLISENAYCQIEQPDKFAIREIDIVKVKGRNLSTKIYEVFDSDDEELKELKIKTMPLLAQAITLYREGQFKAAALIFQKCQKLCPADELLSIYIKRCNRLIKAPPSGEWLGINTLNE